MAVEVVSRDEFLRALAGSGGGGGRKRAKPSRAEVKDDTAYDYRCCSCDGRFVSVGAFERHARSVGHVRGEMVL